MEDILADIDANDGYLGAGFGGFAMRWHGQFLSSGYPPLQEVGGEPPVHPISGNSGSRRRSFSATHANVELPLVAPAELEA